MNESRELKNAEQLEELLLLTEEIQEELEQKDQLIVELKTQLNESLILNEKLNKENRAGNIQALKNDLKLADRALRNEKEKLRSANVMIGEYQNKSKRQTMRLTLNETPLFYERRGFLHSSGSSDDQGIRSSNSAGSIFPCLSQRFGSSVRIYLK
jgi:DNA repair exonuclease SbcCD ATPase subunit